MFVNISGTWKKATGLYVNIAGTWKKATAAYVNISGTWKKLTNFGSTKPTASINPSLIKVNGYQTIGYTLRGNTGFWSESPTTIYWGFQYATSATAIDTAWTGVRVSSTQYYGQEIFQTQDHDLVIPRYVYNTSTATNDIDLVGKYIRFYTIADNGQISDTFNTPAIGPIYLAPVATTAPQLTFSNSYSATQVYVNAVWGAGTGISTYQLQYNNAGTWTNLGAVQSTNPTAGSALTVLVPVGNYDYRVVGYSADPGTPSLTAISSTANYTFSLPPGAFNLTSFTKAYPGLVTTRSLSLTWGTSSNATTYDFTIEGSNDNTIWTTVMSPATNSPVILAPVTNSTVSVPTYKYYRVIIRAGNNGFTQFTYSNSNTPVAATGTAPGAPTLSSAVVSAAAVNISWAYNASTGSNTNNGVQWAISTVNNSPDGSLTWSSPRSFSSPITTGNLTTGTYYIYLRQWNSDELVSVSSVSASSYYIPPAPNAFTFSLTDGGAVTTPTTPTQTRVSAASNTLLFEWASSLPTDTQYYNVLSWGTAFGAGYSELSPAVSSNYTSVNQYNSSGAIAAGGPYDGVGTISSAATTSSPYSIKVRATSSAKKININASTTTGALSWKATYTISNAGLSNGTYTDVVINSMPQTINFGAIATNPQIVITSLKAYSGTGGTGIETIGTAGTPTTLSVGYAVAESGISTTNYTYYTNYWAAGSQRRLTMPSNFANGTTVYISTNGYIGIGTDPSTSVSPPTTGLFVLPIQADLRQTGLWTYSDTTRFYVRWQGAYYSDAAQTIDYQAIFYYGSNVVDIYMNTNNLSSVSPNVIAVLSNGSAYQNWSGTSVQASTLIATSAMTSNTTNNAVDDGRTAIVASIPVSPPSIITAPSVTPGSGTLGVTQFTSSTGSWSNTPTSYAYNWQYLTSGGYVSSGVVTSTYTPPSSLASVTGFLYTIKCVVTATNSGGSVSADSNSVSVSAGVAVPSGGSVSISTNTGNYQVGSVITYSTSGWSGSPTSYNLRLYNGTNPVLTSDPLRASTTSSSGTYTIASSDVPNYFKAFATATNSGGTSTDAISAQVGPAVASSTPATAPSTPAAPTNGWTSGTTYPFSWTAPSSPGTVTGGGAATISSYTLKIYKADSNTGTQPATPYTSPWATITGITSTSYSWTAPDTKYYSAGVIAINSAGLSSSESSRSLWK